MLFIASLGLSADLPQPIVLGLKNRLSANEESVLPTQKSMGCRSGELPEELIHQVDYSAKMAKLIE